jgi:hypothetical protein
MKKLILVAVPLLMVLGCTDDKQHGFKDIAPEAGNLQDDRPPHIINEPDDFMNIAFKCMGVNGIYAHTREAAPVIVPNDPMCQR